jgi:NAD(P)H-dependent flavin oxidoreductase YrpB (nitropropane dioxygenase family)
MRALRNPTSEKVLEMEKQGADIHELEALISGRVGLRLLEGGDTDKGLLSVGQVVGLVHDIPTVQELVGRIMREAEEAVSAIGTAGIFQPLRKPNEAASK